MKEKRCHNCAGLTCGPYSDYCEYDEEGKTIDYNATCENWEPNEETEVLMRREESKADKQRIAELETERAVLRQALISAKDGFEHMANSFLLVHYDDVNQTKKYAEMCKNALQSTQTAASDLKMLKRADETRHLPPRKK